MIVLENVLHVLQILNLENYRLQCPPLVIILSPLCLTFPVLFVILVDYFPSSVFICWTSADTWTNEIYWGAIPPANLFTANHYRSLNWLDEIKQGFLSNAVVCFTFFCDWKVLHHICPEQTEEMPWLCGLQIFLILLFLTSAMTFPRLQHLFCVSWGNYCP